MITKLQKFYIESSTGTLILIVFLVLIMSQQLNFGYEIIDVLPKYIEQQDLEIKDKWESQAKFTIYSLYYFFTSIIGVVILSILYKRKVKFLFPAQKCSPS